jgi:hypothetical protein
LDRDSKSRVTKINFSKDSYIIVSEKLEDIHKLLAKVSFGLIQEVEWDSEPSFDDVIEDEYNTNRKGYREKDYNRY